MATSFLLSNCAVSNEVGFIGGKWNIDVVHKTVSNVDSTYVFPLTNTCDSATIAIGNNTDLQNYYKLDKYICNLKEKMGLAEAKVLVYVPEQNSLWLELPKDYQYQRPKSITINLYEEKPYTAWVQPYESQKWNRNTTEMYTYTFYDRRKKWLCVVDMFNYADTPIARMSVLQTETKQFYSIGLPLNSGFSFDTTNMDWIEMVANWVDGHRKISIENYRKGCLLKVK